MDTSGKSLRTFGKDMENSGTNTRTSNRHMDITDQSMEKTRAWEEVHRFKRGRVEEEEEEAQQGKRQFTVIRDRANVDEANNKRTKRSHPDKEDCLRLDPDIASIMSSSRNAQVRLTKEFFGTYYAVRSHFPVLIFIKLDIYLHY